MGPIFCIMLCLSTAGVENALPSLKYLTADPCMLAPRRRLDDDDSDLERAASSRRHPLPHPPRFAHRFP
jgi:hypothetical protein